MERKRKGEELNRRRFTPSAHLEEPCGGDLNKVYYEDGKMWYKNKEGYDVRCNPLFKGKGLCQFPLNPELIIEKGIPTSVLMNLEEERRSKPYLAGDVFDLLSLYLQVDPVCTLALDIILNISSVPIKHLDINRISSEIVWVLIKQLKAYPFTTWLDENIKRTRQELNRYLNAMHLSSLDEVNMEDWTDHYYHEGTALDSVSLKIYKIIHPDEEPSNEDDQILFLLVKYFHDLAISTGKLSPEEAYWLYPMNPEYKKLIKYYQGGKIHPSGYTSNLNIEHAHGYYKTLPSSLFPARSELREFLDTPINRLDVFCQSSPLCTDENLKEYLKRRGISIGEYLYSPRDSSVLLNYALNHSDELGQYTHGFTKDQLLNNLLHNIGYFKNTITTAHYIEKTMPVIEYIKQSNPDDENYQVATIINLIESGYYTDKLPSLLKELSSSNYSPDNITYILEVIDRLGIT